MDNNAAGPCNICGGTEFKRGPSARLSITKRFPLCARCSSLERHRVVRKVFDAIPRKFIEGTRCLQFSPDPALQPTWFVELTVSVWGGTNSLDMQAIALPDASYDWVYSSHVINHVPDDAAALREMLRVVGDGCVVLNVGGTVFNYGTAPSEKVMGKDRQFKLYGTLYADEIQEVLPHVGVLELVAIDPCTVSIDSVYVASLNQERLNEIAIAAVAKNVHARVFPPKEEQSKLVAPRTSKPADLWEDLKDEVRAWRKGGASARFWIRDDDAAAAHPFLADLLDLCERERVPLAVAAIPLPLEDSLVKLIAGRSMVSCIQHGFDHVNRAGKEEKSEFPESRPLVESIRSIQLGWGVLANAFGDQALPVFVPPWGTCSAAVRAQLSKLGFIGYSASRVGGKVFYRGTSATGLSLASAHVAVNRPERLGGDHMNERRVVEILTRAVRTVRLNKHDRDEPIGIMTHHWGVDVTIRPFLKRLLDETREAGASWVGARDLFVAKETAPALSASAAPL